MLFQFQADDIEMLQSFVDEAVEYLQVIEEEILRLESSADAGLPISNIFRQIHTVKGLSAFFGLTPITDLSHQAESMLDAMRKGKLAPDPYLTGLLLETKDMLIAMISQIGSACQRVSHGEVVEIDLKCGERFAIVAEAMKQLVEMETKPQTEAVAEPVNSEGAALSEMIEKAAEGMIEDFLAEAEEHGTVITNKFLMVLDVNPDDANTLAEVFRRVHTLKGNIGLLLSVKISSSLRSVLKNLLKAFQELESLLAQTRDAKMPVASEVTNLCFAAMDALLQVSTMIRSGSIKPENGYLRQLISDIQNVKRQMGSPVEVREAVARSLDTCACTESKAFDLVDSSRNEKTDSPVECAKADNAENRPINTKPEPRETTRPLNTETAFAAGSNTIRVSGEKLDRLLNVIGALTITKNVFTRMSRKLMFEHNLPQMAREIKETGQFINRVSEELEDAIMSMRMTEVRAVFQKFPRIIRDIALQTGKNIVLTMEGEDTELDKNIIEQISDPLLHIVRNAADHGIETVQERIAAGKDSNGNIKLRAYNHGKSVVIEVEDDGKGMDPAVLKNKAVEKGFISAAEAASLSDEQSYQLIFLPGFSTARQVSEISGRGVGMDVVRSNIAALHGTVKINSELGKGSRFTIQLPLTLMVSTGLLVESAKQSLIIPIENVVETLKISRQQLISRKGKRMIQHRGEVLGVVSLAQLLKLPSEEKEIVSMVVVSNGSERVGLIVDRLLTEQAVLVKPLPDYLSSLPGLSAATILGDGKVALVLNASELISLAHG